MSTLTNTWSGDWEKRIAERVHAQGFLRLADYLDTRPAVPYVAIASELGDDVAAIQVVRAQLKEAHVRGRDAFRAAAKDSLARYLRGRLSKGWGILPDDAEPGVGFDFVAAAAVASWSNSIEEVEAAPDLAEKVIEELRNIAPRGWQPTGAADETLSRAMDAAWRG